MVNNDKYVCFFPNIIWVLLLFKIILPISSQANHLVEQNWEMPKKKHLIIGTIWTKWWETEQFKKTKCS